MIVLVDLIIFGCAIQPFRWLNPVSFALSSVDSANLLSAR